MTAKDVYPASLSAPKSFAIMCKKMTCLIPSKKERIDFAFDIFDKVLLKGDTVTDRQKTSYEEEWWFTYYHLYFFTMVHGFIKGWDKSEFPIILDALDDKFDLRNRMETFLAEESTETSSAIQCEKELRLILRALIDEGQNGVSYFRYFYNRRNKDS